MTPIKSAGLPPPDSWAEALYLPWRFILSMKTPVKTEIRKLVVTKRLVPLTFLVEQTTEGYVARWKNPKPDEVVVRAATQEGLEAAIDDACHVYMTIEFNSPKNEVVEVTSDTPKKYSLLSRLLGEKTSAP